MSVFSFEGLVPGPQFLPPPGDDDQGAGGEDPLAEVRALLDQAGAAGPDLDSAQRLRHWALSAAGVVAADHMTTGDLLTLARWLIEGDEQP